jgi:hypothetical protein
MEMGNMVKYWTKYKHLRELDFNHFFIKTRFAGYLFSARFICETNFCRVLVASDFWLRATLRSNNMHDFGSISLAATGFGLLECTLQLAGGKLGAAGVARLARDYMGARNSSSNCVQASLRTRVVSKHAGGGPSLLAALNLPAPWSALGPLPQSLPGPSVFRPLGFGALTSVLLTTPAASRGPKPCFLRVFVWMGPLPHPHKTLSTAGLWTDLSVNTFRSIIRGLRVQGIACPLCTRHSARLVIRRRSAGTDLGREGIMRTGGLCVMDCVGQSELQGALRHTNRS